LNAARIDVAAASGPTPQLALPPVSNLLIIHAAKAKGPNNSFGWLSRQATLAGFLE
jgi:hypothetical protein